MVVFLNFVVDKFGPVAVFMLLTRTFATYGIDYMKPAAAYVLLTVSLLLVYLFIGYPLYIFLAARLNPFTFIRKILGVIVFGFSTSSSAATLPLNTETNTRDMGVDSQIASFVLPLDMTINMDGTAIMQVVAALFLAGVGGYEVTVVNLIVIMVLALIASIGSRRRRRYSLHHSLRHGLHRGSGHDGLRADSGHQPPHRDAGHQPELRGRFRRRHRRRQERGQAGRERVQQIIPLMIKECILTWDALFFAFFNGYICFSALGKLVFVSSLELSLRDQSADWLWQSPNFSDC